MESCIIKFLVGLAFIILTAPIWVIIGIIWGILVFIGTIIQSILYLIKYSNFGEFFAYILYAFYKGFIEIFSPMSFLWQFSRYDHSWWAFFISIALFVIYTKIIK